MYLVRNSHISTLEGGEAPPPLSFSFFPTTEMIIGRCGYAMRGADTWPVSESGLEPIAQLGYLGWMGEESFSPMDVGGRKKGYSAGEGRYGQ